MTEYAFDVKDFWKWRKEQEQKENEVQNTYRIIDLGGGVIEFQRGQIG